MRKDPTGRALQLLSLLQTHRFWQGAELADRLEITERTVRRDVDRLRELGYPVDATSGKLGGYRLASGAHLPPLVLDDDEAVAVAVGLRYAAGAAIDGAEETSLRALTKIEALLPHRLAPPGLGVPCERDGGTPGGRRYGGSRGTQRARRGVPGPRGVRFGYRTGDGASGGRRSSRTSS